MDWSKSKNILIIVFVVLNMFLLINVFMSRQESMVTDKDISKTLSILNENKSGVSFKTNIYSIYRKQNIEVNYIETPIDKNLIRANLVGVPDLSQKGLNNNFEIKSGSKSLIFSNDREFVFFDNNPSGNIKLNSIMDAKEHAIKLVTNLSIPISNYILDHYNKEQDNSFRLIFVEKNKDLMIFDSKVEILITNKGVTYVKYKNPGLFSSSKKIVPSYQILLADYSKWPNREITSVDIGFKGYEYEQNSKEYFQNPVWRIKTSDGNEKYFNAITGSEVS